MAQNSARSQVRRSLGTWEPTAAQVRAIALGGLGTFLAVVGRRVDLLVLATPFIVAAVWGHLRRPTDTIEVTASLDTTILREGQSTSLTARLEPPPRDCDSIVTLAKAAWFDIEPETGVQMVTGGAAAFQVRSLRWGSHDLGTVSAASSSPWGAFRTGPIDLPILSTSTLPLPAVFDAKSPPPHPRGVVGLNRSSRPGSGNEFNTIRQFQPGDRLRRIHWPTSLRVGELHVTSTYSDEDAHVVLLIDGFSDLGPREGIDGRPTSLDMTVRAAGAIAEHFLSANDRLSVRTVGAADVPTLGIGSGKNHLRRVLDVLSTIRPASERRDTGRRAIQGLDPMALCLVLSPLIDPTMLEVTSTLAARGMTTVVIDTFPTHLIDDAESPYEALAWRMRMLRREPQLAALRARGVAVAPWAGPGSLDHVLRDIARQAGAPKLVRR